jgi:hypothetical protein
MELHKWTTAIAALALSGAALVAQSKPTVAVLPYVNSAIGKGNEELAPLSKGIQDMMGGELGANPGIRLVDRDNVQKLIEEQNLSRDGRIDPSTLVAKGKLLGVHHWVTGTFVTNKQGEMVLTSKCINGETGEIEFSTSDKGTTENFMTLVVKVAAKLNKGMKLPDIPRQVGDAREKMAEKVPYQAVMLYSRALSAKDAHKTDEAISLFKQTLDKFPDYQPAKDELRKLQS